APVPCPRSRCFAPPRKQVTLAPEKVRPHFYRLPSAALRRLRDHRRPSGIKLQSDPASRPHYPASVVEQPLRCVHASAAAHQRLARLPERDCRIQTGVLLLCEVGWVRDQRVHAYVAERGGEISPNQGNRGAQQLTVERRERERGRRLVDGDYAFVAAF